MAQTADKFLLNRLSRASLVVFVAIAVLCALFGEPLTAACAAAVAGIIICGRSFHPGRGANPWPTIQKLFFTALILLLMTSFWTGPWALSHWLYGLALVAFALVPRGIATLGNCGYGGSCHGWLPTGRKALLIATKWLARFC